LQIDEKQSIPVHLDSLDSSGFGDGTGMDIDNAISGLRKINLLEMRR
jgi:hypothetical protein